MSPIRPIGPISLIPPHDRILFCTNRTAALARRYGAAALLLIVFSIILSTSYFILPAPRAHAATINSSSAVNLSKGLVGYWTLDGKDTNWATGKTNDLSGQGNTGQLVSMSTSTSPVIGKIGQGLKFNGTSSYVDVGSGFAGTGSHTTSAWVNADTLPSTNNGYIIFTKGNDCSGSWGMTLYYYNNAGTQRLQSSVVTTNPSTVQYNAVSSSINPTAKTWYHIVGIFDNTAKTITLYVNGVLQQTTNTGSTLRYAGVKSFLGFNQTTGCVSGSYMNGSLDDVRIYNRALSAKEVQMLYATGAANVDHSVPSISKGLVGYWTLDGNNTNWATGKTNDLSGQGNTGQLISMSTTTSTAPGKIGQAMKFDGTNYVVDSSVVNIAKTTVSAWVKITSTPVAKGLVAGFINGISSPTHDKDLYIGTDGKVYFYVYDGTTKTTSSPASSIPLNQWVHVVGTADGANAMTYVNGVQVGSIAAGNTYTSYSVPNIFIQGATGSVSVGGGYMNGTIDDVRIYNRALSAKEVQMLYSTGATNVNHSIPSISKGLVGYWTFDGNNTNWATGKTNDLSGQGNTGQLISMSTTTSPAPGKIGQAMKFDGVNDYVNVASYSPTSPNTVTLAMWIYPRDTISDRYLSTGINGATGNLRAIIIGYQDNNVNVFNNGVYPTGTAADTQMAVTANVWQYIVYVSNGSTIQGYVNGVLKVNVSGNLNPSVAPNRWLIAASISLSVFFNGLIDDVRIYNRALSASEIKQLYNVGR